MSSFLNDQWPQGGHKYIDEWSKEVNSRLGKEIKQLGLEFQQRDRDAEPKKERKSYKCKAQ
jgi:hypothetical protein